MSERRLNAKGRPCDTWWRDSWGDVKGGWQVGMLLGGIVLVLVLIAPTINFFARRYEQNGCRGYAEATGRPTKFASYSWWNYQCLVLTSDGRWVDKDGGTRLETGP